MNQRRIGRAEAFWFASLTDDTVARHAKKLTFPPTFDELFRQKYSLSFREFFLILTTLYARFLMSIERDGGPSPLLLDPESMLGQHFEKSDVAKVLNLISIAVEDCGPYLLGTPRQSWATDFTQLLRAPLIQVLPGKYVCPDLSGLPRFFTDGVFALLRDACDGRDFGQLFGYIFSWYVEQLTARFTTGAGRLARTLYVKPRIKGTRDEACDQAIVWGRIAVLCEVKAGLLTARQKFSTQVHETMKAIDDLLGRFGEKRKGVGQLADTFIQLACGSVLASGSDALPLDQVALLIPAIIIYDDRLGNHAVREYLNQKLIAALDAKNVDRSRIGHLLLFTLKDWEAFERLATTVGSETLMETYYAYVNGNPNNRHSMFHIYALNRYRDDQFQAGLTMEFTDRAMDAVRQTLETRQPVA